MSEQPAANLDFDDERTRQSVLPHCRLKPGEVWQDPDGKHIVGCGDAGDAGLIGRLFEKQSKAALCIQDPPYNVVMGRRMEPDDFANWCRKWIDICYDILADNASLYVWLGADQKRHYQPLPQFMQMMSHTKFDSRSFISMRNQRGYGTQTNWMAVRQELLYYTKGKPDFRTQYTDIPKILRGYYKEVNGVNTENIQRSKSNNIRPGNVWVDVQQVFYRMEENVPGCYAQKPLKAIERILEASSKKSHTVTDLFAHSGTTLIACERLYRKCVTCDIDPIFAEITIRRLERFRQTGKTGWQRESPFADNL